MGGAGQLLHQVEVLLGAAVLSVTAGLVGTFGTLGSLTISFSVLLTVHSWLHAQTLGHLPPVVVSEALHPSAALVVGATQLLAISLGDLGVILPWVADVLEAVVFWTQGYTVGVVHTNLERNFLLHLTKTLYFTVGQGKEACNDQ